MKYKIAIVGLGYVGLPLAVEFGKRFETIGFDIDRNRVSELKKLSDRTLEYSKDEISESVNLAFTSDIEEISDCTIYIVTVPTPIKENNLPDLEPLKNASCMIGNVLVKGDLVIYESTVYPGATEEVCVPLLEQESKLSFNKDFHCGYSPERINPGDKERRITDIKKVVSGSTPEAATKVQELYQEIILAGTHLASSIKIAEASKVIENTQRDVNIALVNEFALIFDKLEIDTEEVLEVAGSKWNFLPFRPGLVGGHCIGVDPFYLIHKSIEVGHKPELILAARQLNDGLSTNIVQKLSSLILQKGNKMENASILVMGLTFKENCPDIRNTKVVDLVKDLSSLGSSVTVYDPWVDKKNVEKSYKFSPINFPKNKEYDAIVIAVAHDLFKEMETKEIKKFLKPDGIIYDLKYVLPENEVDARL